jgi:hypothetical protein
MKDTYQINFLTNEIDENLYPEASMFGKSCIVVDVDNNHIIPSGKDEIKLLINGEYKTYTNVFSIQPYVYNEG